MSSKSKSNSQSTTPVVWSLTVAAASVLCMSTAIAQNTGTQNLTDEFDVGKDLLEIHFDATYDPDDYHAAPAAKMIMDHYGINGLVIGGTYSPGRSWGKFNIQSSEPESNHGKTLWNSTFNNECNPTTDVTDRCNPMKKGQHVWIDTNVHWASQSPTGQKHSGGTDGNTTGARNSDMVKYVAEAWYDTLCPNGSCNPNDTSAAGGWDIDADVWIVEGGQADFTLHVAQFARDLAPAAKKIPASILQQRVHSVQHHTCYNMHLSGGDKAANGSIAADSLDPGWCELNTYNHVYGDIDLYKDATRDGNTIPGGGELQSIIATHFIEDGNGHGEYIVGSDDPNDADAAAFYADATSLPTYGSLWALSEDYQRGNTNGTRKYFADYSDMIELTWILDDHHDIATMTGANDAIKFLRRYDGTYAAPSGQWVEAFPSVDIMGNRNPTNTVSFTTDKLRYCVKDRDSGNTEVFEVIAKDANSNLVSMSVTSAPGFDQLGKLVDLYVNNGTETGNGGNRSINWGTGNNFHCIEVSFPLQQITEVGVSHDDSGSAVTDYYVEYWSDNSAPIPATSNWVFSDDAYVGNNNFASLTDGVTTTGSNINDQWAIVQPGNTSLWLQLDLSAQADFSKVRLVSGENVSYGPSYPCACTHYPIEYEFFGSNDATNFDSLGTYTAAADKTYDLGAQSYQYIKVKLKTPRPFNPPADQWYDWWSINEFEVIQ